MTNMFRRGSHLMVAMLLLATLARGQDTNEPAEPITVEIETPFARGAVTVGPAPLIVRLKNNTEARDTIDIRVESRQFRRVDSATMRVVLEGGEAATVEIPVSLAPGDNGARVDVDSRRHERIVDGRHVTFARNGYRRHSGGVHLRRGRHPGRGLVAVSFPVVTAKRFDPAVLDEQLFGLYQVIGFPCAPNKFPRRLASVVGLDFIVADADGIRALEGEQVTTLIDYVRAGGRLLIAEVNRLPAGVLDEILPPSTQIIHHVGFGKVVTTPADVDDIDWNSNLEHLDNPDAVVTARGAATRRRSARHTILAVQRLDLMKNRYFMPRNRTDIPGLGEVPARAFAAVVVLFVILVGPVNLYWLTKKGKRRWALFTIPAISLLVFLLLVGWAVLVDGFDVKTVTRGVSYLDQTQNRVTAIVRPGYDAGIVPSAGLAFPAATVVIDVDQDTWIPRRRRFENDWTDGLRLRSGWVEPRRSSEFMLIQAATCRRRLAIGRPDANDTVEITNELGTDVASLVFTATDGRHFSLTDLADGAIGRARPWASPTDPRKGTFGRLLLPKDRLAADLRVALKRQPIYRSAIHDLPGPGEYVALVEREIGIGLGVDDAVHLGGDHILRGRFAETP